MEPAESSGASAPAEREPVMDCCLVLTTLSGVTLNVSLSIAKFDRFADLEDHVMDYLISVTDLKVFGCHQKGVVFCLYVLVILPQVKESKNP